MVKTERNFTVTDIVLEGDPTKDDMYIGLDISKLPEDYALIYIMHNIKVRFNFPNDWKEILEVSAEIEGINGVLKYDSLELVKLANHETKNIIISIPFHPDIKRFLLKDQKFTLSLHIKILNKGEN